MAQRNSFGPITVALIYTRVSSDEQAREGVSLDAQLSECRRYAAQQGWILGDEYQDVMTGRRDDRPQYQALLAQVRSLRAEGRSAVVVVAALDRFGRKLLERVRSREELKGLGVSVHTVREGGEVSDLTANILASVAEEESRRLGERVRAAYEHIQARGWKKPGRAALGYSWRAARNEERRLGAPKSVLDVDPECAPTAREMWRLAARGDSVRAISRWLASLPSQLRGERACGLMAIRRLLAARVYIGKHQDGSPGNWPALVEADVFERVQRRMTEHEKMPHQASGRYLLTGLLRCPSCGARMSGAARNRQRGFSRYECRSFWKGAAPELSTCRYSVAAPRADAVVLDEVGRILDLVTDAEPALRAALRRAWSTISRSSDDLTPSIRSYEQVAARSRERIKRLALLFADGNLDRDGYELGRAQVQADLEAATAELERLRAIPTARVLPSLDEVMASCGSWRTVLEGSDVSAKRDVLRELVDRVIPEQAGYRRVRATIEWTELGQLLRQLTAQADGPPGDVTQAGESDRVA